MVDRTAVLSQPHGPAARHSHPDGLEQPVGPMAVGARQPEGGWMSCLTFEFGAPCAKEFSMMRLQPDELAGTAIARSLSRHVCWQRALLAGNQFPGEGLDCAMAN